MMKVIEIMLRMVRTVKKSLVTRGRHKKRKKEKLDLAFNNVKPKDRYFVLD